MYDLGHPAFKSETAARRHLEAVRWPDGPVCPYCKSSERVEPLEGKSMGPGWSIKSICELLNAKGVVSLDEFAGVFEHQAKSYLQKQNPDGAAVMILLLQYLGRREAAERLARAKPAGSA